MINAMVLETPIGPLSLLAHHGALIGSGFVTDPGVLHVRLHPSLRALRLNVVQDLGDISKAHVAYFDGDLTAFDSIAVHQPGTPRRERLLEALRNVRPGETITYAELADRAGLERSAARAAGQACAQNLVAPVVPCHRVLPTAGGRGLKRLGGYYYGLERKDWLLRHEQEQANGIAGSGA